jgi:hypothetical protein
VTVVDMENAVKYSNYIGGAWRVTFLYETKGESVTVYTARLRKDDKPCIEWALHQVSIRSGYKIIRSGCVCLPVEISADVIYADGIYANIFENAYVIHQSQAAIQVLDYINGITHCIIHCVASSGQCATPENRIDLSNGRLPISLLKGGLKWPRSKSVVHCNELFNDEQYIMFPGICRCNHTIGNLYVIEISQNDDKKSKYLLDIDKKEILREIDNMEDLSQPSNYLLTGKIIKKKVDEKEILSMEEYGAL